ncbi:MAG: calcium-binding protein, partial [Planctomycetaceae bacterium]
AWVDGGFDMEFFGVLDLAGFNALTVEGGAQIRDGHFAAYTDIGVGNISIPMVTIQGNFELEVNTSSAPVTIGERTIEPGTCRILIGATIKILGFELSGDVILGIENGVFGIELKDLKLNFFNFIDVNINGYVRSNGEFMFQGSIDIEVNMGPFKLYGGVGVRITNDSFKGWIYGGVDFAMDFGIFEIQFTLAALRANFEITQTSASAELEITVLGFTASGSVAWSWGPPPKIARKEGGTLLLNVGPDGHLRGEDYTDITNESYNIKPGKNPGEVVVSSMGVDETYTGITNISVPDFGEGKDFLYVDPELEMDMVVHGGADADTLYLTGQGSVKAFGGAGNDKIYSGAGNDEIDGGAGDNELYGLEGNDILIGLGGDDYIEGGAGNDRILAGAGNNEIYGGEPDSVFEEDDNNQIIASDGNNLILGGSGIDEITVGAGDNQIHGGDGDDIISTGDGDNFIFGDAGDDQITVGGGISVLNGGAGDDVITSVAETSTATIFGEDGNDIIDVGIGIDQIDGGAGDDIITSSGGDDQIIAGDGDDSITISLLTDGAQLRVFGGAGTDSLDLTGPSNGQPLVMGDHTFIGSVLSLEFDNDIDVIRFTDTSASTILNTASPTSMNYGSIDFSVTGNSVAIGGTSLRIPDGTLRIQSQTLTGDFQSELAALSVNTTGPNAGNIVVRELNSLELVGFGLQTATGLVDVRLHGLDSTLELTEGKILAGGSGLPITIVADDIDFHSGENMVSGTGTLVIVSETSTRNYNIGSAG